MSGRGMGYCAGNDTPGFTNSLGGGFGRGMARGWGCGPMGGGRAMAWGRGGRRGGYGRGGYEYWGAQASLPPSPTDEKLYLEGELEALKTQMETIQKRLDRLSESQDDT